MPPCASLADHAVAVVDHLAEHIGALAGVGTVHGRQLAAGRGRNTRGAVGTAGDGRGTRGPCVPASHCSPCSWRAPPTPHPQSPPRRSRTWRSWRGSTRPTRRSQRRRPRSTSSSRWRSWPSASSWPRRTRTTSASSSPTSGPPARSPTSARTRRSICVSCSPLPLVSCRARACRRTCMRRLRRSRNPLARPWRISTPATPVRPLIAASRRSSTRNRRA
jgi:hypothetical protein